MVQLQQQDVLMSNRYALEALAGMEWGVLGRMLAAGSSS
jgi:hypothetical protein